MKLHATSFIKWTVLTLIVYSVIAIVVILLSDSVANSAVNAVKSYYNITHNVLNDTSAAELISDLRGMIIRIAIIPMGLLLIALVGMTRFYYVTLMEKIDDQVHWYEAILDALSENPISVTDMDKNVTFLNKAALSMLGQTREETIGKMCVKVWGAEICETKECGIEYLRRGKGKSSFGFDDHFYTVIASYIKDRKGKNIGHVELVTNISSDYHKAKYSREEIKRLATNIKKMSEGNTNLDFIIAQPNEYTHDEYDNFSIIAANLKQVNTEIVTIMDRNNEKLQYSREEVEKLATNIKKMAEGNVDIDFTITLPSENTKEEYKNFNIIANNIEQVRNFIINRNNERLQYSREEVERLATNIKKMSEGNIDLNFTIDKPSENTKEEYKNFNIIASSLEQVRDAIKNLILDVTILKDASMEGNIDVRADVAKHKGDFGLIIDVMNQTLDEVEKPLAEGAKVLTEMAHGDLTQRMQGEYKGVFAKYSDDINSLADNLQSLISQIKDIIQTTTEVSLQISDTADTLATATLRQSQQTDKIAFSIKNMARTISSNAVSANQTLDVAQKSGLKANDGGRIVEQTIKKMQEIADVVQSSSETIKKLGGSSQKIGEITSVINEIAEQTNLLSLNAAIEAARAGEQGRGFAVVADSVGKLAISTAGATKEIATMIKGIQNETSIAVKSMEKGTEEVQNGIELADNAGSSLQDILTGINELLEMVNRIAAAIKHQAITSGEISTSVSSVSKVTADLAKNVEYVAATAHQLAGMAETLSTLVAQFKVGTGGGDNKNSEKWLANSGVNKVNKNNKRWLNESSEENTTSADTSTNTDTATATENTTTLQ